MSLRTNLSTMVISTLITSTAFAHPVSWKNGIGIMPEYTSTRKEIEINYSLTNRHAIGLSNININYKGSSVNFLLPRFNYRFLRINKPDSQLNVYLSTGIGEFDYRESQDIAGMASFQVDYETRRIYTLLVEKHCKQIAI